MAASIEIEVPFHDVDSLSIVWFGNYYKYMDRARTALMRAHGLDEGGLRQLGVGLVVVESRCRYSRPLRFGDRVRVTARFTDVAEQDARIHIACELTELDGGGRVARGRMALVVTDADGNLLPEVPSVIASKYRAAPGSADAPGTDPG
jgi:acyl-CoA thioester hydrolase